MLLRQLPWSVALLLCIASAVSGSPPRFAGRRLDDALTILQREGLPIVFSSEIVTPAMRVAADPRATTPREQLDELLAALDLKAIAGPGRTILIVRDLHAEAHRPPRAPASSFPTTSPSQSSEPVPPPSSDAIPSYTDHVTVLERPAMQRGSSTVFDGDRIRMASGPLEADGLNALRTMPGVVAGNDYRTDFSVRGSPYDQIGVVIDGVPTKWLQHTMYRRRDAGSLSMFGNDLLDEITLHAGAFPRLYEDALGAEVDLTIKEGSRESTRVTAAAGGVSAAVTGEGPIGGDRRGSWTAGLRESYQTWGSGAASTDPSGLNPGFGFADLHSKVVYDVSPAEQITLTALAGRSSLDAPDSSLGALNGTGTDSAGLFTAAVRSTVSARTVLQQRVYVAGQTMTTKLLSEPFARQLVNNALGYRGEMFHSAFGGLVHTGAEVATRSGSQDAEGEAGTTTPQSMRGDWATRAGFLDFSATAPRAVSFQVGARISDSTLVHRSAASPWALASWRVEPRWTINASAGASHQFPELDAFTVESPQAPLRPERATHVDLGIENRLPHLEWHATLFERFEHDILRAPVAQPLMIDGELVAPPEPRSYVSGLQGSARGLEVGGAGDTSARLTGWWSYTYSRTRQTDMVTGESFWADLDRRHVLNATGAFRGGSSGVELTLRDASGVPLPGYFQMQNGSLFAGEFRNQVRLPPYVRLDIRLHRTFSSTRHAITASAEVFNAFNRQNLGIGDGVVQPVTGEATGFMKGLEGRRLAVGVGLNFSR